MNKLINQGTIFKVTLDIEKDDVAIIRVFFFEFYLQAAQILFCNHSLLFEKEKSLTTTRQK